MGLGDKVQLIDGVGGFYNAEITGQDKRHVYLRVLDKQLDYKKRNHHLHMAVAPTKNIDRLEWFLEKATEIGIDEFTPIICDHAERKVVKEDRLEKIVTAAVKQSQTAYHPLVNACTTYRDFLETANGTAKYIAHCYPGDKEYLCNLIKPAGNYIVLIGPEGDFSEKEVAMALQNSYKAISLGNTRLRTETAALSACFEINFLNRI